MTRSVGMRNIAEIFKEKFVIPDYQRSYAWSVDQCGKLWDDLEGAFSGQREKKEKENYFLGSLVVYEEDIHKGFLQVVDGQQRLTTLLLFMKALHLITRSKGLEVCIYICGTSSLEPLAGDEKYERIRSFVVSSDKDSDRKKLIRILSLKNPEKFKAENRFDANFNFFLQKICEWKDIEGHNLAAFIDFLLENVEFSFIATGNTLESALKIFSSLNDRGMPLTDADLIKSWVYSALEPSDRENFVKYWGEISEHDRKVGLDAYYTIFQPSAHFREFFQYQIDPSKPVKGESLDEELQGSPQKFLKRFERVRAIYNYLYSNAELKLWLRIIECWSWTIQFPLVAYAFQHGGNHETDDFCVLIYEDLLILLKKLLRFAASIYIQAKPRMRINPQIDKPIKNIIRAIMRKEEIQWPSKPERNDEFINSLKWPHTSYRKGILALYHSLNPKQSRNIDMLSYEVEHILPRNESHCDGWTPESHGYYLDSLGNLTLLPEASNIRALNEYFQKKKKKEYYKSDIEDIRDTETGLMHYEKWTPLECEDRFKEMSDRLCKFIFEEE